MTDEEFWEYDQLGYALYSYYAQGVQPPADMVARAKELRAKWIGRDDDGEND